MTDSDGLLLMSYKTRLRSVAATYMRSGEYIDDRVAETFLRAVRFWDKCEDEGKRFHWTCSILVNVIRDNQRKAKVRKETSLLPIEEEVVSAPHVSSHASQVEARLDVEYCLRKLRPRSYRDEVLRRLAGEDAGETDEEIIERLAGGDGVKGCTRKTRYHRAKLLMREMFKARV